MLDGCRSNLVIIVSESRREVFWARYCSSCALRSFFHSGILRKSYGVFHDRSLLGRCFRGFVLPVLEYCFAVWCSDADTHVKLLDRAVSDARFLTGGVFSVTLLIVDLWQ